MPFWPSSSLRSLRLLARASVFAPSSFTITRNFSSSRISPSHSRPLRHLFLDLGVFGTFVTRGPGVADRCEPDSAQQSAAAAWSAPVPARNDPRQLRVGVDTARARGRGQQVAQGRQARELIGVAEEARDARARVS